MSSPLPEFLSQLGYVLLQRRADGTFSLLSDTPGWFTQIWGVAATGRANFTLIGTSPFLDNFLLDAEAFWSTPQAGFCESGDWIEKLASGEGIALEAKALVLEGKHLLAIFSPEKQYQERVKVLQTARSSLLEHEKLLREIQKKEILLHCIVHDLSQPLSAMRGSFDCLAMESNQENAAKFIELGKHASEQQESMIREILNAFSAELQANFDAEQAGNSAPDLYEAAQHAISALSPAFTAKGVRLFLKDRISTQSNWRVLGEETRLHRIFTNLLENALRYTPSGSSVSIGIEDEGAFLKAFVDDEGPGLPTDLRPAEMFALFGKGKKGGGKAGLGLYFCRITVERWGGSIGCSSLAEIGSRFWFRLPKAVPLDKHAVRTQGKQSMDEVRPIRREKQRALRILLADDQQDVRLLTAHQLQRSGHEVVSVANGKAAVESAESREFDVIFLDEEMPVLGGVEAARSIHELQKTRQERSAIVALTGNNTPQDRDRLLAAGFDYVIGKPFRLESLEAFLLNPSNIEALDPMPEKPPVKETASWEDLLQRVGGDEKLLRQMLRTFLRETPMRMQAIQKALKRKSGGELSSIAHALKGSVAIFGAPRAVHQAQSLQDLGRISDFQEAAGVFDFLQEEIAKLQQNLRVYAQDSSAQTSPRHHEEKPMSKTTSKRKR